ncbi:hypothetical protein QE152_g24679 [Popillia japonica]|uniref:Uncharacterized protein n=1 Tax=Popillia japonica TaxID=7064 RepID=A0AAW1K2N4_POPJA
MEKWGFGPRREVTWLESLLKHGKMGLWPQTGSDMVGEFVKANGLKARFKNGIPGEDWFIMDEAGREISDITEGVWTIVKFPEKKLLNIMLDEFYPETVTLNLMKCV